MEMKILVPCLHLIETKLFLFLVRKKCNFNSNHLNFYQVNMKVDPISFLPERICLSYITIRGGSYQQQRQNKGVNLLAALKEKSRLLKVWLMVSASQ